LPCGRLADHWAPVGQTCKTIKTENSKMEPEKTLSTLQRARAGVCLQMLDYEPRIPFALTNQEDCETLRSYCDASPEQFEEIVDFLYENDLIEIKISDGAAWITVSPYGEEIAASSRGLL